MTDTQREAQLRAALGGLLAALRHSEHILHLPKGSIEYHELELLGNHPEFIAEGHEAADDGEFLPEACPFCAALRALSEEPAQA